jgi:DNA-binding response OmpR family regulator
MQVVLVTDNPDDRDYYTFVLQQVGLNVSSRSEFTAAMAGWPQSQSELILVVARSTDSMTKTVSRFRAEIETPLFILIDSADLVLPLPVSPRVLAAYCRNQMHRSGDVAAIAPTPLKLGAVVLDPSVRSVRVGRRKPRRLTKLEFRLLHLLMTHRGQVIPPDVIVDRVWGYAESGSRELVRGLISRLRGKIELDPASPKYVRTIPGVGYVFDVE